MNLQPHRYIYNYAENGYYYLGLHRKLLEFDPKNTTNEVVLDCFNSIYDKEKNKIALYQLMNLHLGNQYTYTLSEFPMGFFIIFHEIYMSWNNIIHQIIFKEMLFDTFYGEYCDVLNKIISIESTNIKEIVVYRGKSGDSVFHLAAKLWLLNTYDKHKDEIKISDIINKELAHILGCYVKLGRCFGNGMSDCILSMRDFSGKDLRQFLIDFSLELVDREIEN